MPTTTPVDLSDSALWRNGFPDDLFAELRRERPLFHHELTDGVAKTVKRDFWMATKHRHAQRIHRDTDSFTATDGPLIQGVGIDRLRTDHHQHGSPRSDQAATGDVARLHAEGDRQARGGHPQARGGDDRPACSRPAAATGSKTSPTCCR